MSECEENSRYEQFKGVSRLACCQNGTHVKRVWELKGYNSWSIAGQNFQSDQAVSSQLRLATRSNREVESPECPV